MEMMKRKALGRGLGALIPLAAGESDATSPDGVVEITRIRPNPYQPRQQFGDEQLNELCESIREKGLLQPLLVRRRGDVFELIAGERRLRAAERVGLKQVPVVIRDVTDQESLEISLIENLQREDLNPIEEARAYQRLATEFGLKQEEIARRVSKSRSAVANSIRLLQLPENIQRRIAAGEISAGHARTLLGLGAADAQISAAGEIARRKLSVREAERLARKHRPGSIDQRALESRLSRALATKVRMQHRRDGTGRIEIEYYSLAELDGLVARLCEGCE